VESILEQIYSYFELILIDDGSSDNTRELIERYGSRIKYHFQPNKGVASARNRGIHLARGEYIAFLDSDDLWNKRKLEKQMAIFQKYPSLQVCYTQEIWLRQGKWLNPKRKHLKFSGWIYEKCLPLCIISPSSVMIHRSVFTQAGYFDSSLPVCEDYDLWLRICARYPVYLIDEKLITKRGGHPDQLSRKYWGLDRFRVIALEKILHQRILSPRLEVLTLLELIKKCQILIGGFWRREKWDQCQKYSRKIEKSSLRLKELGFALPEEVARYPTEQNQLYPPFSSCQATFNWGQSLISRRGYGSRSF